MRRALTILLLALASIAARPIEGGEQRWNILWLTVEDMSPWIGPYGDHTVPTPNLDRLAARGIRFDNAFADSPVCAPARTALITGLYPTRIGAMHMRVRSRSKAAEQASPDAYAGVPLYEAVPPAWARCFPELLREQGYYTSNRSKTDYQFVAPPTVWDASSGKAHYRNRPEGQPFFAVFNHTGTHESQAFPDSRRRPEVAVADEIPLPPFYPDTPAVREAMSRTYNNIAAMDTWVGARLGELEEDGLLDSTVVIFFSDHGVGLPRGKRSVYGTGTRVPLLVSFPEARWPESLSEQGLGPGSSTERIVSFIDLGPTALSLAGIQPDERLDGRAFLGAYKAAPRELAFFHADRFDAARDRTRAVTDGRHLLIRNLLPEVPHLIPNAYRERLPMTFDLYALRDGGEAASRRTPDQWQVGSLRRPPVEFYNSQADPWEVRPLAEDELGVQEAMTLARLDEALSEWMVRTGDLGLLDSEEEVVREHLWPPQGVQPATAPPALGRDPGGLPTLACATEGASIGYRVPGAGSWKVTRSGNPLELPAGSTTIEAVAHRIGHARSSVVTLELGGL